MLYMLDLVFEVGFGDAPEVYGDMFVGFEVAVNKWILNMECMRAFTKP